MACGLCARSWCRMAISLMPDVYETDIRTTCPNCRDEGALRVAAKSRVLEILGYC